MRQRIVVGRRLMDFQLQSLSVTKYDKYIEVPQSLDRNTGVFPKWTEISVNSANSGNLINQ